MDTRVSGWKLVRIVSKLVYFTYFTILPYFKEETVGNGRILRHLGGKLVLLQLQKIKVFTG